MHPIDPLPADAGAALPKVLLTINVPDETAEVVVLDSTLAQVHRHIGPLQIRLQPGLYQVQARIGAVAQKQLVVLWPTDPVKTVQFQPLRFDSPIPLANPSETPVERQHRA